MASTPKTILVAEDEPDVRDTIADALRSLCDRVLTAADGEEALRLIQAEKIHAVCCDIKMPRKDGLQLLRDIRSLGYATPFVIVTGYCEQKNILEALRLGATDFLEKPCDIILLRKVMKQAVGLGTLIDEMDEELRRTCHAAKLPPERLEKYYEAQRAVQLMRVESQLLIRSSKK